MRIVIKIGSSLTKKDGTFNDELIKKRVEEISAINKEKEIILVSSVAIACGMEIESLKERPKDSFNLQILSGEGQVLLMKKYYEFFSEKNVKIAQVLLTHHNFSKKEEKETIKKILEEFMERKIIQIINENDMVSKEEIEYKKIFTDNDILAALVSLLVKADLLIILTDVDGLYTKNPKEDGAVLIKKITKITKEIKKMARGETNSYGTGGMYSKIIASEMLLKKGISTIIANGNYSLIDILENKVKRTTIEHE
ncbi:MAG: glutamate 5-kinase [Candidatus Pacearchaeota archaeon]